MAGFVIPKDNVVGSSNRSQQHNENNTTNNIRDENALLTAKATLTKPGITKGNGINASINNRRERTVLGVLSSSEINQPRKSLTYNKNIANSLRPSSASTINIKADNYHTRDSSASGVLVDEIINDYGDTDVMENVQETTKTDVEPDSKDNNIVQERLEAEPTESKVDRHHFLYQFQPAFDDSIEKELTSIFAKYNSEYFDPNDEDIFDITMVSEYRPEIINYLHELEMKYLPSTKCLTNHPEIEYQHRSELVCWIIKIHQRFNLLPETLFSSINIMDRFLCLKDNVSLTRYQLCGAVALFIASKFEEINYPTIKQMCYVLGNQFSIEQFMSAEKFMIRVLKFDLCYPGPMSFLRNISKADDYDNEVRTLSKYFLEVALVDPRFVTTPSSFISAGSMLLARRLLSRDDPWSEKHVFYSGYTDSQLIEMNNHILNCCLNYNEHHLAVYEKYSSKRYKKAAIYVQEYLQTFIEENNLSNSAT